MGALSVIGKGMYDFSIKDLSQGMQVDNEFGQLFNKLGMNLRMINQDLKFNMQESMFASEDLAMKTQLFVKVIDEQLLNLKKATSNYEHIIEIIN